MPDGITSKTKSLDSSLHVLRHPCEPVTQRAVEPQAQIRKKRPSSSLWAHVLLRVPPTERQKIARKSASQGRRALQGNSALPWLMCPSRSSRNALASPARALDRRPSTAQVRCIDGTLAYFSSAAHVFLPSPQAAIAAGARSFSHGSCPHQLTRAVEHDSFVFDRDMIMSQQVEQPVS